VLFPDWEYLQSTVAESVLYGGKSNVVLWERGSGALYGYAEKVKHLNTAVQRWRTGQEVWGKKGIVVSCMGDLECTLFLGDRYDNNVGVICPNDESHLSAIWSFCSSSEFQRATRRIDQKMNVTAATFAKVPFDLAHWQQVAAESYPNGLPEPESDDPTQWLFHGRPEQSTSPLQVALARMLGYRWPAELDTSMRLSQRARDLVARCDELLAFADVDGLVPISSVRGERPAAERLLELLRVTVGQAFQPDGSGAMPHAIYTGADGNSTGGQVRLESLTYAAGCKPGTTLDDWLRNQFFEQHCKLFHQRPFIWHIWDGRKDGFSCLVNYHKLNHKALENLTYSYLGDWIAAQAAEAKLQEGGR